MRNGVILESVAAINTDEFANNWPSMSFPDCVDILSDAVGSFQQDSLIPDGKVSPLAVEQILISFNFLPLEILAIIVGSSASVRKIWRSAVGEGFQHWFRQLIGR